MISVTDKLANKHDLNSSKCLVDPSWEEIDPSPDVNVLFKAFNERFFGNKLSCLCVSYSEEMKSCLGMCSYQRRAGKCTITLSQPLLTFRPRRDLVETLLHEMIHTYLFVTHNDRNRDEHRPQFHKHMDRINAESGTNITVHHDLHDDMIYKQYCWRCTGSCQNKKPLFGIVKRAINRAPGPKDKWWAKHLHSCGGEFKKIEEPEKPAKSTKSKTTTKKPETMNKPPPSSATSKSSSIMIICDLTSPKSKQSLVKTNNIGTDFPNTRGRSLSESSIQIFNPHYNSTASSRTNPTRSSSITTI